MAARELFLDAAYLIALAVPADAHHAKALQLLQQTESSTRLFITTQAVLLEVGDALCKPKHRAAAFRLLSALEADPKC
jgi:predicted nucleic acid-binding protein